jgi:sortase A
MLEIKTHQRRWPRILVTIIILVFLAAGCYILLTIFSPTLPVLSGRAAHETEQKLVQPAGTYGNRLYIPKINVDVAIVSGNDSGALEKGAWHRKPENGDPIKGGNFVLSAHRFVMDITPQGTAIKSPFYNIGNLTKGDRVFVDYQNKRYQYEIVEKYTVKPDGVEVEAPTKDPQLTLYSCTLQGSSDGRDVLEARPITESE